MEETFYEKKNERKEGESRAGRNRNFGLYLAFIGGVVSKFAITPSWAKEYSVPWSDEIGTLKTDIPYGDGEANKFDLYLPGDNAKERYGLVVYLHAGGFTSGDKGDDRQMLAWLCSRGYVACGINYTLRTNTNNASVLTQSNEIKSAIPKVIEAAEAEGYSIDKLAMAGGSAGHTLAMLYAYRDAAEAPVPVVLTFGAVGPSCFHIEDWDNYGFDQNTEESYQGAAGLFSVMAGEEITVEEIKSGSYLEKMKPISAVDWITPDSVPTVVAYGAHDRVQPFKGFSSAQSRAGGKRRDYQYFECPHSGHGLQNDNAVYKSGWKRWKRISTNICRWLEVGLKGEKVGKVILIIVIMLAILFAFGYFGLKAVEEYFDCAYGAGKIYCGSNNRRRSGRKIHGGRKL